MWIVRLTDQRMPYGPFDDRASAGRFADFLTTEVDPATVEPLNGPPAERLFNPVTELLNWRDAMHAGGHLTARPSVRGGAQLNPSDEDGYREEQGT